MKRQVYFQATPAIDRAIEAAVAGLQAKRPAEQITRSQAIRCAIVAFAASLQRGAKSKPTPVAQSEVV